MVYFLVIRNSIAKDNYDLSMTYSMVLKIKGYDVSYALREDGQFKDYVDGTLHIDYDWHLDRLVDKGNVTVLKDTWCKLPFIVSCLIGYDSTEKEINEDLKELIEDVKKHIDGFKGFSFEPILEQEISGTRFIQPIIYSEGDEVLYNTGKYYISDTVFNAMKKFGISVFDFIFGKRYVLIADDTRNTEFQKMIEGNSIDLENNTVIAFYNWDNIIVYEADNTSTYKRGKNGVIVKRNISEEVS